MIFVCGRGPGAAGAVRYLAERKIKARVFTHDDDPHMYAVCDEYGIGWTQRSVNDPDAWPWHPAAIVSIGYLRIIQPHVLEMVNRRVINCHYALLPNHRGRSAVPWAIVDGDKVTGITYHWVDEGIDTGRVILQAVCSIEPHDTQASLFAKLHRLAIGHFPSALKLAQCDVPGMEQEGDGQYHRAGPPHGGEIDPLWEPERIERFIRAMTYPPLPPAHCGGTPIHSVEEFWRIRRGEVGPSL